MILSHKHKFIFIKTQKTAGTSLEIALSEICGPDDVITPISPKDEAYRKELGYRGPQNCTIPLSTYSKRDLAKSVWGLKRLEFYNHIGARAVRRHIPADIWNSYFKFSFERNPYDKVISLYHWSGKRDGFSSILEYIKSGKVSKMGGFNLYTDNSMPIVDEVYQYEQMEEALRDISQKLKLDKVLQLPPRKAKGSVRKDKRPYQEVLTEEEKRWITRIFAREIAYFGYEKEE